MTKVCRLLLPVVVAGALLSIAPPGQAQAQAQAASEIFKVEYGKEAVPRAGWAVEGYVSNESRYRVTGVRLRVEVLDEAGAVVGQSFGWVYGNIASGGRSYFVVPVPRKGADYRITVLSYSPLSLDSP